MLVYLCRHGEAVDGTELLHDESRYLTSNGRVGVAAVGRGLREHGDVPDLILTSPLVRAVQTAELLAQAVDYRRAVEVMGPLAPGGALGDVLEELSLLDAETKVFLVGHEPQMSSWAAQLLGRPGLGRAFHKGAVARLDWQGPAVRGTAEPGFYMTPQSPKPGPL